MTGSKVRWIRRSMGLSQQHLSELLGVACSSVASWEKQRQNPDDVTMGRVSEGFLEVLDGQLMSSTDFDQKKIGRTLHNEMCAKGRMAAWYLVLDRAFR